MHGLLELAAVLLCLSFPPPSTPPDGATAQVSPTGNGRQDDASSRPLRVDTQNEERRRSRPDSPWERIKLSVAHVNVIENPTFHLSEAYWRSGNVPMNDSRFRKSSGDLDAPIRGARDMTVLVQGDCNSNIRVRSGSIVHIVGDLRGRITVSDHCEVIVGGNVHEGATIDCWGIVSVFVGGDVRGSILSRGMQFVWVGGNVTGELTTGMPVTEIRVSGSFDGTIRPHEGPGILMLEVRGFCAEKRMKEIAEHGYPLFAASLGKSDRPPGLYPDDDRGGRASWVIHSQQRTASTRAGAAQDN